jgi:dienelactone hydrolase
MPYFADAFLEQRYEENQARRKLAMPGKKSAWQGWHDELKATLFHLLGMDALPRTRPDMKPELLEEADCGEYLRQRVLLHGGETYPIPCYVLAPKQRAVPAPAVVAVHGHGYGSRDPAGLLPDGTERPADDESSSQKIFAQQLAKRGFVVIVPELLGFGDRRLAEMEPESLGENSCYRIGTSLLLHGQTLAAWRTYDVMCAVDYLAASGLADMKRIGIMGVSGGGMISVMASIFDDRIKGAVISSYANVFKDSIMHVRHCVCNYIPGILRYAEMPDILALIAPKPLLLESGQRDHIFPIEASLRAFEQLKTAYSLLGQPGNVAVDEFPGPHGISGAKAYGWLAVQI